MPVSRIRDKGPLSLKHFFQLFLLLVVHYTHQYMLHINTCYICIVAIVGCTLHTSIHAMYCCYCWLYTTHINTCYVLLAVHYTHQYMLCIVAIVGCTLHTYQYMLCIVAIVGCTLHYTHQYMPWFFLGWLRGGISPPPEFFCPPLELEPIFT